MDRLQIPRSWGIFENFCVKSNLTPCKVTCNCKLQKKLGEQDVLILLGEPLLPAPRVPHLCQLTSVIYDCSCFTVLMVMVKVSKTRPTDCFLREPLSCRGGEGKEEKGRKEEEGKEGTEGKETGRQEGK